MANLIVPREKTYNGVDVLVPVIIGFQTIFENYTNYRFHHVNELGELKQLCRRLKVDLFILNDTLDLYPIISIQFFIENILPISKHALIVQRQSSKRRSGKPFNLNNTEILFEWAYPANDSKKKMIVYFYTPNPIV
jgi:hypothetical protein